MTISAIYKVTWLPATHVAIQMKLLLPQNGKIDSKQHGSRTVEFVY